MTFKAHVRDESGDLVEKEFVRFLVKDPTVAKKLLPTMSDFFFGSTDYDAVYLEDVEDTIKQLTEILKEPEEPDTDCYYEASR